MNEFFLLKLANNKEPGKKMKKKSKKRKVISKITNKKNDSDNNKNTAKIVLFIFGIGPIIGIIIFLASKGFFNSPQMWN